MNATTARRLERYARKDKAPKTPVRPLPPPHASHSGEDDNCPGCSAWVIEDAATCWLCGDRLVD